MASRELSAELLAAYVDTEVVGPDGRIWSGAGAGALDHDVWVITAENPWSELQDDGTNAAAMARLETLIIDAGVAPVRLVGRAADHSWSEDCFAVAAYEPSPAPDPSDNHAAGADAQLVLSWGRELGQHAVFLLTSDRHAVVECSSGRTLAHRPRTG
jgi:hypothetical protein